MTLDAIALCPAVMAVRIRGGKQPSRLVMFSLLTTWIWYLFPFDKIHTWNKKRQRIQVCNNKIRAVSIEQSSTSWLHMNISTTKPRQISEFSKYQCWYFSCYHNSYKCFRSHKGELRLSKKTHLYKVLTRVSVCFHVLMLHRIYFVYFSQR